jgi:hypothetical protein
MSSKANTYLPMELKRDEARFKPQSQNGIKVIGLGGQGAVGKSTAMKKLIKELGGGVLVSLGKDRLGTLNALFFEEVNLFIIGKYEEGEIYSGTDKLAMSIAPMFKMFIEKHLSFPITILFEGARLFTKSIKDFLITHDVNHQFVILELEQSIIDERRQKRQKLYDPSGTGDWTETIIKRRKTAVSNMEKNYSDILIMSPSEFDEWILSQL